MFNWLHNNFHKHHKILLGLLLVMMIASFVLYGSLTGSAMPTAKRTIYRGVDLSAMRETRDAREFASFLSLFGDGSGAITPETFGAIVNEGLIRGPEASAKDQRFQQILGLIGNIADADAAGIPMPDDKAMGEFLKSFPLLQENGVFSPARLQGLADRAHNELGFTDAQLQHVLALYWRLQKYGSVIAPESSPAPDILAAREIEKDAAKWKIETAAFPFAGFTLKQAPDDKRVAEYFEKNKSVYRIAEKIKVGVIKVSGVKGAVPADPSKNELFETLRAHVDAFPEINTVKPEGLEKFLTDNRTKLAGFMVADKAGEEAALKLSKQIDKLSPIAAGKPDAGKLAAALKSAGLTLTALPAYSAQDLPKNTGIPDAQLAGALSLSETHWRTGASSSGQDAYVFVYEGSVPARDATLAEVRGTVLKDLTEVETRGKFAETGRAKAQEIAAAMKTGKTFADAAKAAGYTPAAAEEFTFAAAPAKFGELRSVIENLATGAVSDAMITAEGFTVVHVISRTEIPVAKNAAELAVARDRLGRREAAATAGSISAAANN